MFADEEGIETGLVEAKQIVVGAEAGFADGDTMVRDALDQFQRGFRANREGLQVAIVDAKNARIGREGAVELGLCVDFNERLHAEFAAKSDEFAELRVAKRGNDQQ